MCPRPVLPLLLLLLLFSAVLLTPSRAADLAYTLGPQGLTALTYRGQSLLPTPPSDNLQVVYWSPQFRRADGTTYDAHQQKDVETPTATHLDLPRQTLTKTYAWGKITGVYGRHGDSLFLRLTVANDSPDTLTSLSLLCAELKFPTPPTGDTADPGMFYGGGAHPLHDYPLTADPKNTPPALLVDFGAGGVLDFCNEDVTSSAQISIPYSTNQPTMTQYPLNVSLGPVKPHAAQTVTLSLRFGPPGTDTAALAGDLYHRYTVLYPATLVWRDRRPIGTNFLATSETHPPKNPRGWFTNAKDVDTTTPEGRADFRKRLMAYADGSVRVLKGVGAQGVVTWDPEGQEYGSQTYYGDPRLTPRLAPEMEDKDATGVSTVDAYFAKFRAAGLRVGVCIRPQQISFVNGAPIQQDSPDPAKTLIAKIAYAKKRWGCTLFYADSTVDAHGALSPDVFRAVNAAFPDVLVMPENQTTRDYAYSAPFDSFYHHGVTTTYAGVRALYPGAFSVLYVVDDGQRGTIQDAHDRLLAAVKRGDILLFHGWYAAGGNAKVKQIYEEAHQKPAGRP